MHRLFALLIIPFLAVGQAYPHSHGGSCAQGDHTARPHVHIGHGTHDHDDHQHHDHQGGESDGTTSDLPIDHDSDAIYVGGGQFFLPHTDTARSHVDVDLTAYPSPDRELVNVERRPLVTGHPTPVEKRLPLFLLHAALRL